MSERAPREIHGSALRLAATLLLTCTALANASQAGIAAQGGALEIQFIGNEAFRLSDGETVLLSDFPYQSGYAGYMEWSLDDIAPIAGATSFITHEHADHWEAELWHAADLRLIAPPAISAGLDPERVVPWSVEMHVGDATVRPARTEHTAAHHSYRVSWRGLELYFTGDTESTVELLAERDLDVAFVSPWLMQAVAQAGERIDAELVVIYHHREQPRRLPDLQPLWVPRRGDVRRVEFP